MTSTQAVAVRPYVIVEANCLCVRVAADALRALAGEPGECGFAPLLPSGHLVLAQTAFRAFRLAARSVRWARPPRLEPRGAAALTKDECRLLRALAAAQAGNVSLLDNYLYKLALDRACRACLAEAVSSLAAALLECGFVLCVSHGEEIGTAMAANARRADVCHGRAGAVAG